MQPQGQKRRPQDYHDWQVLKFISHFRKLFLVFEIVKQFDLIKKIDNILLLTLKEKNHDHEKKLINLYEQLLFLVNEFTKNKFYSFYLKTNQVNYTYFISFKYLVYELARLALFFM